MSNMFTSVKSAPAVFPTFSKQRSPGDDNVAAVVEAGEEKAVERTGERYTECKVVDFFLLGVDWKPVCV